MIMAVEFEKMQLKIAIVRMQRGVQRRIKENSKPYAFICPEYLDINQGDYVVCEVSRKTNRKNVSHDFRVGRVEDLMTWSDREILQFRPNSFIVCKVDCDDFDERCINIKNKKYSLWARYNAVDRSNPDKKVEGVPMNVFDHLIDNMGKLHFEKLNQYSHKMTMEKKAILEAKNRQKNKSKK